MSRHDIGRTQMEAAWSGDAFEYEGEYESEYEDGMDVQGFGSEVYGEYAQPGPFTEDEEMELASELLGITDEDELDQFLGKAARWAARKARRALKSPVVRSLARQALPVVGTALGNLVAPGAGGAVGARLASGAGQLLGLELEGLSPEDQEFEVARRIVRMTGEAAQIAAGAPGAMPPDAAAQRALTAAARRHAPGLTGEFARGAAGGRQQGRWRREGGRIVLYGA